MEDSQPIPLPTLSLCFRVGAGLARRHVTTDITGEKLRGLHQPPIIVPPLLGVHAWEQLVQERGWAHWDLYSFQSKELGVVHDVVHPLQLCQGDVILQGKGEE